MKNHKDIGVAYSRIAVPEISVDVRQGIAGVGVDQLNIHVQRNTTLVFGNVLADEFTGDILMYY